MRRIQILMSRSIFFIESFLVIMICNIILFICIYICFTIIIHYYIHLYIKLVMALGQRRPRSSFQPIPEDEPSPTSIATPSMLPEGAAAMDQSGILIFFYIIKFDFNRIC